MASSKCFGSGFAGLGWLCFATGAGNDNQNEGVMNDNPEGRFDRDKWNKKYRRKAIADFPPSALFRAFSERIPFADIPKGDVLELACGLSGTALAFARRGRKVLAVDVSDVGMARLADEARKQGLDDLIEPVTDDLVTWIPSRRDFALVICSLYWDKRVFGYAHELVKPQGYLAWEGFSPLCKKYRSDSKYVMGEDEPLSLLPASFTVIEHRDVDNGGSTVSRRLIARNAP
uniref:Methyltransferase domain-containing protein n=1 Tax=Candidatus Kentrum sp. LFY TaxID=2126342 RepID=A0A450U674_9GAMM|nr:MAG: Methyltransferase domain-containing protein [Candidatus Kentron sp. LFY]